MKYMIATAEDHVALTRRVSKLMREHGWEPLGAHAVITWKVGRKQRFEYSQVLINQGSR